MANRRGMWDRLEAWATRRRNDPDEGDAMPPVEAAAPARSTERLERAEQQSAEALATANAAIDGVHDLEDWLRGRDRRLRETKHTPERRRPRSTPPKPPVAHAVIITTRTERRLGGHHA